MIELAIAILALTLGLTLVSITDKLEKIADTLYNIELELAAIRGKAEEVNK